MSNLLHDKLQEGDSLEVTAPFGDFFLDDTTGPVVLLSAGVGVTPLSSMLHSLLEADATPRAVSWIQVVRSRALHPLRDEVRRLLALHPERVRSTVFYSAPGAADVQGAEYDVQGRMDLANVDQALLHLDDKTTHYYVCGPEGFMADIGKKLKTLGVEPARVHAEVFGQGAIPI